MNNACSQIGFLLGGGKPSTETPAYDPRKDFGQSRTSRPVADTGTSQRDHRSGCTRFFRRTAHNSELFFAYSVSSGLPFSEVCKSRMRRQ
jgi:hypothetical protein